MSARRSRKTGPEGADGTAMSVASVTDAAAGATSSVNATVDPPAVGDAAFAPVPYIDPETGYVLFRPAPAAEGNVTESAAAGNPSGDASVSTTDAQAVNP